MVQSWENNDRDMSREPCPDRIIDDVGGAFGMGCVGGFLWHFGKGARHSPRGERFATGLFSAKSRAPILGGNFAVWGGTFSTFDCSLQYIRRRDDHWNAIASGFITGGVLAARGGWKAASRNAVVGGVLLAIIEGVAALLVRSTSQTPREQTTMVLKQEEEMRKYQQSGGGDGGVTGFFGMNPYTSLLGGGEAPKPEDAGTSFSNPPQ
jgi:import inner membrane translocase subunit TIM17